MNFFRTIRNWQSTRRTTKQLNLLSARQLDDLGLSRVGNKYVSMNRSS